MPVSFGDIPDWPECAQCGSDETELAPATEEWTCQSCGFRWTFDEVAADGDGAEEIPEQVEWMLEEMLARAEGDRDE